MLSLIFPCLSHAGRGREGKQLHNTGARVRVGRADNRIRRFDGPPAYQSEVVSGGAARRGLEFAPVIMSNHSATQSTAAAAADEEIELLDAPPDVRLLVKRRQMFEVQEALEAQKQLYAAQVCLRLSVAAHLPAGHAACEACFHHMNGCLQEKELHAKEEALQKRDVALQESLLRFSKFLQVYELLDIGIQHDVLRSRVCDRVGSVPSIACGRKMM